MPPQIDPSLGIPETHLYPEQCLIQGPMCPSCHQTPILQGFVEYTNSVKRRVDVERGIISFHKEMGEKEKKSR